MTRDRYVIRRIKLNPYLYLRQYRGARAHARPVYQDLYLGRVPERLLHPRAAEELHRWVTSQRRRLVRRLSTKP